MFRHRRAPSARLTLLLMSLLVTCLHLRPCLAEDAYREQYEDFEDYDDNSITNYIGDDINDNNNKGGDNGDDNSGDDNFLLSVEREDYPESTDPLADGKSDVLCSVQRFAQRGRVRRRRQLNRPRAALAFGCPDGTRQCGDHCCRVYGSSRDRCNPWQRYFGYGCVPLKK